MNKGNEDGPSERKCNGPHSAFILDMRKVHHNCTKIAFSMRHAKMRSLVMPF